METASCMEQCCLPRLLSASSPSLPLIFFLSSPFSPPLLFSPFTLAEAKHTAPLALGEAVYQSLSVVWHFLGILFSAPERQLRRFQILLFCYILSGLFPERLSWANMLLTSGMRARGMDELLGEERHCSSTWEPAGSETSSRSLWSGFEVIMKVTNKRWRCRRRRWSHLHRGLLWLYFLPVGDGNLGLVWLQSEETAGWLQNLPARRWYSVKVQK